MRIRLKEKIVFCLTLLYALSSCYNNSPSKDAILLKIGDFEVTKNEFDQQIIFYDIDNQKVKLKLLNNLVKIGFLHNFIVQNNLDFGITLNNEIKTKLYKKILTEKIKIKEKELKRIYDSYNDILYIDYIWLPDNYSEQSVKLFNSFKNRAKMNEIITNIAPQLIPDMAKIKFESNKAVFPGTFIPELGKKIYEMERGEVDIFNTEGGYHIVKLSFRDSLIKNDFEKEKVKIRERLVNAYMIEKGEILFDKKSLDSKIKINRELLNYETWNINPIPDSIRGMNSKKENREKVIAMFNNKKYTILEVVELARDFSNFNYILFCNPQTRVQAIRGVIYKNLGLNPDSKNDLSKELDIDEAAIIGLMRELKKNGDLNGNIFDYDIEKYRAICRIDKYEQGLTYIKSFIRNLPKKNWGRIDTELKEDMLTIGGIKRDLFNQTYLLTKEPFYLNLQLTNRINFTNEEKYTNNDIVAKKGKWVYTVKDFLTEINSYSLATLNDIVSLNSKLELIKYIDKTTYKEHKTDNEQLIIYKNVLGKIDIGSIIFNRTYKYDNASVVAQLDNIKMTLGKYRELVSSIPILEKEKLKIISYRENFVKTYLITKYLANYYQKELIVFEHDIETKFNKEKKYMEVKKYIELFEIDKNMILSDYNLDNQFKLLMEIFKNEEIDRAIISQKKLTDKFLNESLLNKYNISLNQIKYFN